jgi:3-oxoacyl-[acyl-carrier protein] reductase
MLPDRLGLAGRVVVVAGAGGGGIGTATCRLLAEAGVRVAGVDVRREALEQLEAALDGTAGPHLHLVADVRRPDEVAGAVDAAAELGPLHGLVHVAGGLWPHQWDSLLRLEPEVFDDVLELNLRSALLTCRAVAAGLAGQGTGGSLVTVASVAGLTAMPYGAPYAAAKAAMLSLTRTAALEWGQLGIRVNAVAPGSVRTPKNAGNQTAAADDSPAERAAIPLAPPPGEAGGTDGDASLRPGRVSRRGSPEDVAGAVLFLMSDLARWVSGQVLTVDGGSSARPSFLDEDNIPVFVRNQELRSRLTGDRQP